MKHTLHVNAHWNRERKLFRLIISAFLSHQKKTLIFIFGIQRRCHWKPGHSMHNSPNIGHSQKLSNIIHFCAGISRNTLEVRQSMLYKTYTANTVNDQILKQLMLSNNFWSCSPDIQTLMWPSRTDGGQQKETIYSFQTHIYVVRSIVLDDTWQVYFRTAYRSVVISVSN